jgi:hypothetical protein
MEHVLSAPAGKLNNHVLGWLSGASEAPERIIKPIGFQDG